LSVEVEGLLRFPAISSITHPAIVATTVSPSVIPVTVNSKFVPLFGAISVGPDVTVPVVPESVISHEVNVEVLITSSKVTVYVAESTVVGSTCAVA
jgi:hypothetical protein